LHNQNKILIFWLFLIKITIHRLKAEETPSKKCFSSTLFGTIQQTKLTDMLLHIGSFCLKSVKDSN